MVIPLKFHKVVKLIMVIPSIIHNLYIDNYNKLM